MTLAVSGAHRVGKTTLVGELAASLPGFTVIDEPYYLLEAEGHPFAGPPTLEDFELQLERSIGSLLESGERRLFDRCPADLLAYLITHEESDRFDAARWLPEAQTAMRRLDLVIFVPIEDPDRVGSAAEDEGRALVHETLREMILEDSWGFGVPAIEVAGTPGERARRVLTRLGPGARRR